MDFEIRTKELLNFNFKKTIILTKGLEKLITQVKERI